MDVVNQPRAHGEDVTDRKLVEKIHRSHPQQYDTSVTTIEECKDLSANSIQELIGSMMNHESRIQKTNESLEIALQTQATISRGRERGVRGR